MNSARNTSQPPIKRAEAAARKAARGTADARVGQAPTAARGAGESVDARCFDRMTSGTQAAPTRPIAIAVSVIHNMDSSAFEKPTSVPTLTPQCRTVATRTRAHHERPAVMAAAAMDSPMVETTKTEQTAIPAPARTPRSTTPAAVPTWTAKGYGRNQRIDDRHLGRPDHQPAKHRSRYIDVDLPAE
jgi:hypothetical protein